MKILNYGSLNIDHVYSVGHLVRPGETLASTSYAMHPGGKGANQSAAIARAGGTVHHAGKIGRDGRWLVEKLAAFGVDTTQIRVIDGPSGHAIIEVDSAGENSIIIHGGGNQQITRDEIDQTLAGTDPGDILLLQNEINNTPYLMEAAAARSLSICLNPAPFDSAVLDYPLDLVSVFVVNETEAQGLAGDAPTPERALEILSSTYPAADVIVTLGASGLIARSGSETVLMPASPTSVVDTTAAGDTFIGYYLARRTAGDDFEQALRTATLASAIAVSRPGAMPSIPLLDEVIA